MKSIIEIQGQLEQEMGDHFKLHFSDYTPKHGGLVEIDHHNDCVFSEPFDTVVEAYEKAFKYFKDVKDGYIVPSPIARMSPRGFIEAFCDGMKISKTDLLKKTRKREIVQARQTITALIYKNLITKYGLQKIGLAVNQDHATVLHSKNTVNNLLQMNKAYRSYYATAVESLSSVLGVTIQY